jgi:hypothetical protein
MNTNQEVINQDSILRKWSFENLIWTLIIKMIYIEKNYITKNLNINDY